MGLVALGLWSLPATAAPASVGAVREGPPKVLDEPIPLENRAGPIGAMARGERYPTLLSGTLIKQTSVTTTWFMYPGACVERALGTWSPRSTPVADSLQPTAGFPNSSGYTDNQPNIAGGNNTIAYTRADFSQSEILWHVIDVGIPAAERPAIIAGSRSLWCGKFDPIWVSKVGYPNLTYQILYIDTGLHAGPYTLSFQGNISAEWNYDFLTILGAGGGNLDPLENRRDLMDELLPPAGVPTGGPNGNTDQIVSFTGSITTPQTIPMNPGSDLQIIAGATSGQPNTVGYSITIDADHRVLYWVLTADCLVSSEDGLWPEGHGAVIDLLATSDNGSLYNDEAALGGIDPFSGNIVKGTYGTAGFISCRSPAGVGELWQLAPGAENVTADFCSPQKVFSTDLFFEGGDPITNLTINKQSNSIVSCTFPVPAGTGSIFALWGEYLDLPRFAGYVQSTDYRFYKGGAWSNWQSTSAAGGSVFGALQAWTTDGDELAAAAQADSVQLRWSITCIPQLTADGANCSSSQSNALLYDDFSLRFTAGVPAPLFGIRPSDLAQSTFIDGTIKGTNCQMIPCWPGELGSDLEFGAKGNWHTLDVGAGGISIISGLRKNGMGVNWKRGFRWDSDGAIITNGSYNAAYDFPRMIFRLFDPTTATWSPFDSTELIAAAAAVSGADTTLIDSSYFTSWPPYDKLESGASLPAGFSINGVTSYAGLRFLPRGTRVQYYFKGVDINGIVSYAFSSDALAFEVEDLPTLPGGSVKAPDIIEFCVLPSVYPVGPAGSLLAGRTSTPVLNLDGTYTRWSFGYDPMTQALRGLGVRADRYRQSAIGIGGQRLPGGLPSPFLTLFPNYAEYPLVDSLASWYRIIIQSGHTRTGTPFQEQDATVVEQWWRADTGSDQGDRCVFLSGDDAFNAMLNTAGAFISLQTSLAQNVFGVNSATNAWSGTNTTSYPTIDDRFAAASAGPTLATPGTYTYPVDGSCPGPNRFDALVKVGDADARNASFYPNAQVAGIARSRELDNIPDKDRSKAMAYGFSIQFIRDPGYGPTNANYTRSGAENRMRVLYKFLTSCRGIRTAAAADSGKCWPCPSPGTTLAQMQADWASQSAGFRTGTYGPLYPIQAGALATSVEEASEGAAAPHVNALEQNRPNPFNPETTIPYSIAARGRVAIRIFDIAGRLVRTLIDRVEPAGSHVVRWNGRTDGGERAPSGVYFYRIAFPGGGVSAKKLMILR
jgi:flagellar hook capping protein FlgD